MKARVVSSRGMTERGTGRRRASGGRAGGIRTRLRNDRGSILPLVVGFAGLGLALVIVVTAATSLYQARKQLFTLADGAALAAAEAFEIDAVDVVDGAVRVRLGGDAVASAVDDHLAASPGTTGLDQLTVVDASSPDGTSAQVTLAARWRPPIVGLFLPDGIPIDATATARSVFG